MTQLTKISAKNYKNLDLEAGVELSNLNIFVGPNGAGKSNLVKLLNFLHEVVVNDDDNERGVTAFQDAFFNFGGVNILTKTLSKPAVISFLFAFENNVINWMFQLPISTNSPENPFLDTAVVSNIQQLLKPHTPTWHCYNSNQISLRDMRKEVKLGPQDIYVSAIGDNLTRVLHNLIQTDIDFEDSLNEAMRAILPSTRKVRSTILGRQSLAIEWYLEGIKEPFYLDEMSDGTIRMLGWATILLSPKLPSLLILEEPEVGLHVAWLRHLAEWIKRAASKTQVIVSTHSPDLLDCFTDQVDKVYVFERSANKADHFAIKRLTQEAVAPWLAEGWELGDLYRVGDPSVGGWPW